MACPMIPSPKKPTVGPAAVVPFCVSTILLASVLAARQLVQTVVWALTRWGELALALVA
jgi:hypothetical protein